MGIVGFSPVSILASLAAPLVAPSLALARRLGLKTPGTSSRVSLSRASAANWASGAIASRMTTPNYPRSSLRRPYSFLTADQGVDASLIGPPSVKRLKVVRVIEASARRDCAGRMVISGRMADVCAELDRMAQRESS